MDLTPIPSGNDVQVNTFTANDQTLPSVTALAGGGFVVTWRSASQDDYASGIYGQRYAADGTALGSEFRVSTFGSSGRRGIGQTLPSVTALADGGFVVTWTSDANGSLGDFDIYGKRYAANGTVLGGFQSNTFTTNIQYDPSVTALAGGGFVVTWSSNVQDGSGYGIYGQRYAADGTAVGSEFRVNTFTTNDQHSPSVTALAGGGFVVTWSSNVQDGSGYGIYGQRYAADGTALGSEFQVNPIGSAPSVAALAGGGFLVTYNGSGSDIYGQRYAADGTALGSEFRVNTFTTNDQHNPSVTALVRGGGFVVTWSSNVQDGSGNGIYGQRYAADGTAVGSEFRVNQITAGDQLGGSETVAALADGRLVQVWSGTGFASEVFFRLINVPNIVLDDAATTTEDTPVNIQVLANDGDFEGTPAIIGTTNGAHGTVAVNNNGTSNTADDFVVYTPATDFNGTDSFTYTVNPNGTTETATVSVTVNPIADIVADAATTNEDTSVNILVLANDTFEGTEAITATTSGAHGTVTVNDNGTAGNTVDDFVVYTPTAADFNGTDSFTYMVTSGGVTETATVSLTITAVADIVNDTATTNEDTAVNVLVQANDTFENSGHQITATSNGAHGTVAVNNNGTPGNRADDFVVYTPAADFNGTDNFTYTVTSGGVTETASVSLTVNNVPDVHDIVNDTATTNEDTPVNIQVLANDAFEGTPAITGTTNGAHGTVAVSNNGTPGNMADDFVVYTPAADFNGTDNFTYTVTSGGVTETASVSLTVNDVHDIVNDTATTNEDTPVNIQVLANDTFEGTPAITATTNGAHGTVAVNNNGTPGNTADDFVVYTPAADFNGTDTLTYGVTSGGVTETGTVIVTALNTAPTITSNGSGPTAAVSVAENSTAVTTVAATDPDAGQTLSYSIVGGADSAFFGIDATGTLAFITGPDFEAPADAGANNIYDVTVQVSDGNGGSDTQAIAVTVANIPGMTWTGTNGTDTFLGTIEEDAISGLSGNDTLNGGGGIDTLNGGGGADAMAGGTGNDRYYIDNASDQVIEAAGAGADTVYASANYALQAGQEVERLRANAGATGLALTGNDLANYIFGGTGADTLNGGGGIDTLNGSDGADAMAGGTGNDRYYIDNASDQVIEAAGAGADTVYASANYALQAGQEVERLRANAGATGLALTGNDLANYIFGGTGADTLNGGGGIDTLNGSDGADAMAGGTGNDRYYIDNASDQVIEAAGAGADTVYASANYALQAGQEVERLRANAGATGLALTGNDLANYIVGGVGADTLNGGGGNNTVFAGQGNDSLISETGRDSIQGNEGNDTIRGGLGIDTITGGSGNDLFAYGAAADDGNNAAAGGPVEFISDLNWAQDQIWVPFQIDFAGSVGGLTSATLTGRANEAIAALLGHGLVAAQFDFSGRTYVAIDQGTLGSFDDATDLLFDITGESGTISASAFTGGVAPPTTTGTSASEVLQGGMGNDTITGGGGNDTVFAGFGGDSILSGAGADLIFGNENNDSIDGGTTGNNTVFAGQGNDGILSGNGRDTLQGNEGNDTIQGDLQVAGAAGVSIDTISGGTGNDVFRYTNAANAGGGDGNNAGAGGPVEFITDVNFNEDRFQTTNAVVFANNTGAGTGANLATAANNALVASAALSGNANNLTATTFTFAGSTYLAINQAVAGFQDGNDLLIEITGATGTIDLTDFKV